MNKLVFSGEVTFHLPGRVNRHNLQIWASENPHKSFEHERDSPNINVFAVMSREKLYGPVFFIESTVTGIIYLDMLRGWLMPQLQEDIPDILTTVHEIKTQIRQACANTDQDVLHNVWQEVEYRFDVARATRGAQTELY
jgi:hypothetical protein